ncbi:hypothetical protein [Bradyrhizobium sp. UFLA05-112]
MSMRIEGEPARRFKIFRADLHGNANGDALAAYDSETEVLAHKRRQDWHYVIYEQRIRVTVAELKARIWECPICTQMVIARTGSRPILPSGFYDNCKLKDHMLGDECIARRDPATARRLLEEQ